MRLVPLQPFILANVTFRVEYFNSPVQMGEDDKIVDFILKAKMHYGIPFTPISYLISTPIFFIQSYHLVCLVFKHSNSVVKKAN
jgi:hypothetical protein